MTDSIRQLARDLDRRGFLVTCRAETEARAVAELIGTDTRTLRRWRDMGVGPAPSRTMANIALYRIEHLVEWIEVTRGTQRPDFDAAIADDERTMTEDF